MIRILVILFLLICPVLQLMSQENDYGIWSTASIEKKLNKFNLSSSFEIRTMNNSTEINRYSIQLNAEYKYKMLKTGLGYQFIYFNDVEYNDYQPRQRYLAYFAAEQKFGNFSFSLRERVQRTIKDESDRIKENGNYDNYKINPEWIWRNRFKIYYNIPKFSINPSFAFESFYQLNNPDKNKFCDLRYTLSFTYKYSKKHKFEIYGLINKEINVKNPITNYVTGIDYTFSF